MRFRFTNRMKICHKTSGAIYYVSLTKTFKRFWTLRVFIKLDRFLLNFNNVKRTYLHYTHRLESASCLILCQWQKNKHSICDYTLWLQTVESASVATHCEVCVCDYGLWSLWPHTGKSVSVITDCGVCDHTLESLCLWLRTVESVTTDWCGVCVSGHTPWNMRLWPQRHLNTFLFETHFNDIK